jgi:beta-1,4-mannosyl-glycoprotein beta-1,4-N-acetylglucosaminyltransferase
MKIYDCFTFYHELDLLELRLTELYDVVDHFVLVEANTTYTSRPKPFYFEENKQRYSKWLDKIIHVKVEDMPNDPNAWVNDIFQRDQIFRGIADADANDLIMISDLDEIIRPAAVESMRASNQALFALRMTISNFKFNYLKEDPDRYNIWAMAGRRNLFDEIKPDAFRQLRFQFMGAPYQFKNDGCEVVEHGGWHFGYMGDKNWLLDKAQSFAHTEVNNPEFLAQIDPEASIEQGTSWDRSSSDKYVIVELDSYFPKTLVNNKERYQKYILDNPVTKALDLLPAYPYNS